MPNPWDRQRDDDGKLEGNLWFDRFTRFRLMGPKRSLLECVNLERDVKGQNRSNIVPGSWRRTEEKWAWRSRCELWDESERQRIEAEFCADCDEWRAERFRQARAFRDKAVQYLAFPTTRSKSAGDDGKTYIVEALSPKFLRDAIAVLETADKLARITTGETLPVVKADVTSGGKSLFDLEAWKEQRSSRLNDIEQLDDGETQDG